jgi:hypothetical protein
MKDPTTGACRPELRLAPLVAVSPSSTAHTFNERNPVRGKLPRSFDGFSLGGKDYGGPFGAASYNRIASVGTTFYEYWIERLSSGFAHA